MRGSCARSLSIADTTAPVRKCVFLCHTPCSQSREHNAVLTKGPVFLLASSVQEIFLALYTKFISLLLRSKLARTSAKGPSVSVLDLTLCPTHRPLALWYLVYREQDLLKVKGVCYTCPIACELLGCWEPQHSLLVSAGPSVHSHGMF